MLVLALDAIGTFVFALRGAAAGLRARLGELGASVLSFAALKEWWYVGVSLAAGLVMFYWHPRFHRLQSTILVFDAAGLAVFAVAGTLKALAFDISPVQAPLLGMLTGVGGGIIRDLLV